ncbi:MAG: (E)-4-hydroxy-3-methylbut-2-enyl-diphosphate synthase [Salinivirgaceae bacterium]|nr:(E)-4-hydroxy-3-methylbut-2-enyl-diphosphate synthase [Salinivirgaceae bacterium]
MSFSYKRFATKTIKVGNLLLGGNEPIRVQSMANTSTHDVEASVQQAISMIKAGAELVRYTVVDERDANALHDIKQKLVAQGYNTPIVADVHFNPNLADIVAQWVDKVRINPGNYLERRATFKQLTFTDEEYNAELQKLRERLTSFLNICSQHNTAVRIGTNHGSLSDRIMSRYGDTPAGMVEATMEFLRICKELNFNNVAVSLKSSNTVVMVQAYRLLAKQMQEENLSFPLHLGVTEAGSGTEGIIKSSVGIGTLMIDGLGDTIRVSLTGAPESEIAPAKELVEHINSLKNINLQYNDSLAYSPYTFTSRAIGNHQQFAKPIVVADITTEQQISPDTFRNLGFDVDEKTMSITGNKQTPDVVYLGSLDSLISELASGTKLNEIELLVDSKMWVKGCNATPLFSLANYLTAKYKSNKSNWVMVSLPDLTDNVIKMLKNDPTVVVVACSRYQCPTFEQRAIINKLILNNINLPVVISNIYKEDNEQRFQIHAASDSGLFFIDGLANGLWISNFGNMNARTITDTSFTILQASRARYTKTEYISCPSCGRTLYDIERAVNEVKRATSHLIGLKIAVMGCIVNGPGEMADADYGYVGAGPKKVNLYKGKTLVRRGVDEDVAPTELLKMIEEDLKK